MLIVSSSISLSITTRNIELKPMYSYLYHIAFLPSPPFHLILWDLPSSYLSFIPPFPISSLSPLSLSLCRQLNATYQQLQIRWRHSAMRNSEEISPSLCSSRLPRPTCDISLYEASIPSVVQSSPREASVPGDYLGLVVFRRLRIRIS